MIETIADNDKSQSALSAILVPTDCADHKIAHKAGTELAKLLVSKGASDILTAAKNEVEKMRAGN